MIKEAERRTCLGSVPPLLPWGRDNALTREVPPPQLPLSMILTDIMRRLIRTFKQVMASCLSTQYTVVIQMQDSDTAVKHGLGWQPKVHMCTSQEGGHLSTDALAGYLFLCVSHFTYYLPDYGV